MKKLFALYIVALFSSVAILQTTKAEGVTSQQPVEHITQTKTYRQLKNAIDQIRLVDTHEHLRDEKSYLKRPADFLCRMLHYVDADLRSAGMTRSELRGPSSITDIKTPFPQRWKIFQKYWKEMRFTGYGRALDRTVKDIYGLDLDKLTPETAHQLNEKIVAANKPGLYRHILKEKARIDLSIVDKGHRIFDPEFFVNVRRYDNFLMARTPQHLEKLEEKTGVKINSLADLEKALETSFEKGVKAGMVGIKSGLAYSRRIYYPRPTDAEAKAAFDKIKSGKPTSNADVLPLQNYMMHQVCRLADKHKMPFQIHTGLQTGSGNIITNSKPTDLVNLIQKYPNVKFVIFHGSYPYGHELSTIAKNFKNVYIDMCWLHIISPKIARDSLSEWIETVPGNKITGFGGDYGCVESVYGHAEMAREVIAEVLADKVLRGYMTEANARELAVKLLRNNAIDLYQLKLSKSPPPAKGKE